MKRFRLPTKLALAIVPIGLVALVAGAWLSWKSLEEARVEERVSYSARVAADAVDALVAVSSERAVMLDVAVGDSTANLPAFRDASDRSLERLRASVRELVPRASGPASGIAGAIFSHSSLAQARLEEAREGEPLGEETQQLFDEIGNRLITVASQSTLYFGEPGPAREGEGAVSLARASFASFQQEQLLTRVLADESLIPPEEFRQRFAALESTVVDWLQNADDNSPTVRALGLARSQLPEEGAVPDPETFPSDRNEVLAGAASDILGRVATAADRAAGDGRTEAATVAAVVLGVLFLTVVLALILGRSTVRRVRSITRAAQHVTDVELPRLVDALSNPKGELEDTVPEELEEGGPDEVGELARSFSSLHRTLVEVANRQMEILRRGVSEIFVTLARRNGSLVDRQLALIDDLESSQEDPEILEGYYKLDHLATRMRRNAESLLVLAGSESPRMWSEPLDMGEVVRAALGEVDEYQRVEVLALEPARLKGRLVTDLAHLMSELLDNATQFSPPSERVRVTGLFDDEGYVITVADSGLGISEERMAQINRLIADPPVLGLALEPTLGMYVVARLAGRHGIGVRLVPGVPGTTVRVTLPRELLEAGNESGASDDGQASGIPRPPAAGVPPEPQSAVIPPYAFRTGSHPPREEEERRRKEPERDSDDGPKPPTPSPDADPAIPPPPEVPPERDVRPPHSRPGQAAPLPEEEDRGEHPKAPHAGGPGAPDRQPGRRRREDVAPPQQGSASPPQPHPGASPSPGATSEGDLPRRADPGSTPETGEAPPEPTPAPHPRPASSPDGSEAGTGGSRSPRPVDGDGKGTSRDAATEPPRSLPTRRPGSSFQGDVAEEGTSTVSQRGAEGIRSALDGFQLGRDVASQPSRTDRDGESDEAERPHQGDET